MSIDVDNDKALQPISKRERLAMKLVLLLVYMIYPAKYGHQLDKFIESVKEELK